MTDYAIEKNVPLPNGCGTCYARYPFADMEVGDSFVVAIATKQKVHSAASQAGKRMKRKYTVRKISPTKARCWRIK